MNAAWDAPSFPLFIEMDYLETLGMSYPNLSERLFEGILSKRLHIWVCMNAHPLHMNGIIIIIIGIILNERISVKPNNNRAH